MIAAIISAVGAIGGPTIDPARCWSLDLQAAVPLCRAIAELGRFNEAKLGPVVGGRATVEALFEPDYGTGFRNQSVALLQEVGGSWQVIWEHRAIDGEYLSPKQSETHFRWKYLDRATRIRIDGVKVEGPKRSALPVEMVCFQAEARRFEPC